MAVQQSMSFLLLVVVISAGAGLAAGGPSTVITSTCSAAAKGNLDPAGAKIFYDNCVSLLSAYPEAASAVDVRGLAIAAVDLTAANVTNMEGLLQDLIGNLQNCLGTYKAMRGTVAGVTEDLRAGRIDAEVNKLRFAGMMPEQCLIPYIYAENQSPIDKEIVATVNQAGMACRIMRQLESAHKGPFGTQEFYRNFIG